MCEEQEGVILCFYLTGGVLCRAEHNLRLMHFHFSVTRNAYLHARTPKNPLRPANQPGSVSQIVASRFLAEDVYAYSSALDSRSVKVRMETI